MCNVNKTVPLTLFLIIMVVASVCADNGELPKAPVAETLHKPRESGPARTPNPIPAVSIAQDISLVPGDTVDIPVLIANYEGFQIRGYSLRLHYDQNVLSNPTVILEGTQSASAGDNVKFFDNPADGIGKCSVAVFHFEPEQSEILVKVRFDVDSGYSGEPVFVSLAGPNLKTTLFDSSFEPIESYFTPATGDIDNDGSITLDDVVSGLKTAVDAVEGEIHKAADVNFDRRIDSRESIYAMRYIAGIFTGGNRD